MVVIGEALPTLKIPYTKPLRPSPSSAVLMAHHTIHLKVFTMLRCESRFLLLARVPDS